MVSTVGDNHHCLQTNHVCTLILSSRSHEKLNLKMASSQVSRYKCSFTLSASLLMLQVRSRHFEKYRIFKSPKENNATYILLYVVFIIFYWKKKLLKYTCICSTIFFWTWNTSHFLQWYMYFKNCSVDAWSNEMVTESTSEGLEGKSMLQNVVRDVYWRDTLIVRRMKVKFLTSSESRFVPGGYDKA
jgi:hypothetical protein